MRAALLAVSVAIVGQILASEVKAWSSWLQRKIRRRAVANLPIGCRERYNEEWESGIEEIPGEIFKLAYSIGLLRASLGIREAALAGTENTKPFSALLKRLFDISISGMALVLCAPLFLVIAIAIKLSSPGPVFFSLSRIGKNGQVFRSVKFRTLTMPCNAEKTEADILNVNEVTLLETAGEYKITPIGRLLRKYFLNELPQLFSVLRGDMSMVGPRARNVPHKRSKGSVDVPLPAVAPGITGLAQIASHSVGLSPKFLDKLYATNRSLWLDSKIVIKTITGILVYGTYRGLDDHSPNDEDD